MTGFCVRKGDVTKLGSCRAGRGYNFAVAATSDTITLYIYDGSFKLKAKVELDESYKTGNVFACHISGMSLEKAYYGYECNDRVYVDPYAKTVTDCSRFGEKKKEPKYVSRVVLDEFDWEGDKTLNYPYEDCIFYKIHVRGFTKSSSSGVKAKGTFEGIKEKIPYLKELGITTIELMPAYEFDEMGRLSQFADKDCVNGIYTSLPINTPVNYWGYVSALHFAPKAAYTKLAASKSDYTVEMKSLIKELHKNGIEVVMEMFFNRETPNMILDCLRYWVTEFHIDGVHLYGSTVSLDMAAADPVLARTKILTVCWNGEKGKYKHMANYNEGFLKTTRCFLKGDENQLSAFINASRENSVQSANINYITNHNGFTMEDLVSYERKHNEANGENNRDGESFNYSWNCGEEGRSRKKKVISLRKRQVKNAFMMLLLSAGTPLILAGDEFGNSQSGNNNPYCLDNEVSWVNWRKTDWAKELTVFVKSLIEYRKQNKILHMPYKLMMSDSASCGYPDISYHGTSAWYNTCENYDRHVGVMYCGRYDDRNQEISDYKLIYVAYNMHWEEHVLALPKLPAGSNWSQVVSSDSEGQVSITEDKGVNVAPRTVLVLEAVVKNNFPKTKKRKKHGVQ